MMTVRLEPAALWFRTKHSTTELPTALGGALDNCLRFLVPDELFADPMNMQNIKKETHP